ncbi:UNVERIFIED_CONTAM: hypothetical protein HDU68_004412 [Siphonaria sp. JEL0065]|nr:hypothetical protein HDU68_004412 [Siphonaria sp. JEL0065]
MSFQSINFGFPLKAEPLDFDEFQQDSLSFSAEIESHCGSLYSGLSRSSSIHTEGQGFEFSDNVFENAFQTVQQDLKSLGPTKWVPYAMNLNVDIDTEMNKLNEDMLLLSQHEPLDISLETSSQHSIESNSIYSCNKAELLMGIALGWVDGDEILLRDEFRLGCLKLGKDGRLKQYNDILQTTQAKIETKISALNLQCEKSDAHNDVVKSINANVAVLVESRT